MSNWEVIPLGPMVLFTATVIGMAYFVWAVLNGKIDLMGSDYENELRKSNKKTKADLSEVNDPTVWLPEFAKTKNVNVVTSSSGGSQYVLGGVYANPNIWVEVTNKSQEQLDEERRVYFEAKEKKL